MAGTITGTDPEAPSGSRILSWDEVADLCYTHGDLRGEKLVEAIAICQGESGRNAHASNSWVSSSGERRTHAGLFQVSSMHAFARPLVARYDPVQNVLWAKRLGGWGGTWSDWEAWTDRSYRARNVTPFMDEARAAAQRREGGLITPVGGGDAPTNQYPAPIGPVPVVDVIDLTREIPRGTDFTPQGVLADIMIFEGVQLIDGRLPHDPFVFTAVEHIVGTPQLDLSIGQTSQFTFALNDPKLWILASGAIQVGSLIEMTGLRMKIAAFAVGGGDASPKITVDARAFGIQALKRENTEWVVRNVSPTEYAARAAARHGMGFVGRGSAVRDQIARTKAKADDNGRITQKPETEWEVLQRLAGEVGYICFEAANTLFFAPPTWLVRRPGAVRWLVAWPSPWALKDNFGFVPEDHWLVPWSVPDCRRSEDAEDPITVNVQLSQDDGLRIRPGDVLVMRGMHSFDGDYIVDRVSADLDGVSSVTVEARTPVDPIPTYVAPKPEDPQAEPYQETNENQPSPETGTGNGDLYEWPTSGEVTSLFGPRNGRQHQGIDIATPVGTPVRASRAGRILRWYNDTDGYGSVYHLEHEVEGEQAVETVTGQNIPRPTTRYAHLSQTLKAVGEWVEQGEVIAFSGGARGAPGAGNSTGPHLHFEIRKADGTAVDPLNFLRGKPPRRNADGTTVSRSEPPA